MNRFSMDVTTATTHHVVIQHTFTGERKHRTSRMLLRVADFSFLHSQVRGNCLLLKADAKATERTSEDGYKFPISTPWLLSRLFVRASFKPTSRLGTARHKAT